MLTENHPYSYMGGISYCKICLLGKNGIAGPMIHCIIISCILHNNCKICLFYFVREETHNCIT